MDQTGRVPISYAPENGKARTRHTRTLLPDPHGSPLEDFCTAIARRFVVYDFSPSALLV
jgi:hypothetical protein